MCEIYSKLTIKTQSLCFYCQLWTYLTYCSDVFIVEFEQVNTSWVTKTTS